MHRQCSCAERTDRCAISPVAAHSAAADAGQGATTITTVSAWETERSTAML